MTAATSPVGPGDRIAGKYRVDGVLGVGGMGVVVAATHEQLDQRVALKFLLPAVVSRPDVVERFLREARAAVKIQSEHVARVLDVGTLDTGAPYMVMEYLEGEDIEHLVERQGPLPVAQSVGYLLEACEAIAEAHAAGIVHRDLKPGNLFLATRPSGPPIVKVLDFGISKTPLTAKDQALTQAASAIGSPSYMSPEQFREARDVDVRSDIWSLGVVLHEMLTGRVPFYRDTMAGLIVCVLHDPHPSLLSFRGDVPPGLQPVLDRCLEKDAARRFADVAELAQALAPFGPPRCEQSVERIVHVIAQAAARGPIAAGRTTGGGVVGGNATTVLAGARNATTTPKADPHTLAPTSTRATQSRSSRVGLWIALPALVALGGAVAVYVVRALTPARAPASSAQAAAAPVPSASLQPAAPVSVAPAPLAPTTASASVAPPASSPPPAAPSPLRPAVVTVATASATTSPPSSPKCKLVSYFDSDGEKHFKQQCQ